MKFTPSSFSISSQFVILNFDVYFPTIDSGHSLLGQNAFSANPILMNGRRTREKHSDNCAIPNHLLLLRRLYSQRDFVFSMQRVCPLLV